MTRTDGRHDFDFLMGHWRLNNRRLVQRLQGSDDWEVFESTSVARPLLNGLGNQDEYRTPHWPDYIGMSFRFFDPAAKQWAIYWADTRSGGLLPPVFGAFSGDTGVFNGSDTFDGRPIHVRFIWSGVSTANPRWEQAFSTDEGQSWETNWTMDFTRVDG